MSRFSKSLQIVLTIAGMFTAGALSAQTADAPPPKFHIFTNVAGTGTAGRITKWTDTSGTLADSVISENASGQIAVGSPATVSNKLHVFTTGNADGISVDGTQNPAVVMRNNGTTGGYFGLATASTAWFSNAVSGDVAVRSETGNVLLGRGGLAATLAVAGTKVGIGTSAPTGLLHLYGSATSDAIAGAGPDMVNGPAMNFGYAGASIGRGVGFLNVRPDALATAPNPSLRFMTANYERMIITNTGAVGIGTSDPEAGLPSTQEAPLHIYSAADKNTFGMVHNVGTGLNAAAIFRTWSDTASVNLSSHASTRTVSRFGVTLGGWNEILSWMGNGLAIGTSNAVPLILGTATVARITLDGSGNVTIGNTAVAATTTINNNTVVNGTLTATRVIGAVYQDVAEWVPATTHMEPGTVVVLNRERRNEVMPSARPYDTAVAGVVSENPGVVLGVAGDSKAQIATTGRVKVHVDATAGAIAIGDLLVTSDKSGTAMKSQPVDLGGVEFHRPGTVIGKALEPLPSGEGEILVLLSLQ